MMWSRSFATVSAETTVENLEKRVSDMANDKTPPPWFIKVMKGADLLAIVKSEGHGGGNQADHILVVVLNTISKVADKAMVKEFENICKSELMPQQVGVGVKFAAELLAMGLRMTLHVHGTFILISIDLKTPTTL